MDNRKGLSSLESSRSRLSSRLWSLNGSSQRSVFTNGSVGRTDGEGRDAELVARVRIAAEAAPLTMRACQPAPAQQSQQAFRSSSVAGCGWAEGDRSQSTVMPPVVRPR